MKNRILQSSYYHFAMKKYHQLLYWSMRLSIGLLLVSGCKTRPPEASGAMPLAADKTWFCRGNEPFWMVQIESDSILFRTPEELVVYPYAAPVASGDTIVFVTKKNLTADQTSVLRIKIVPLPCTDTMSGEAFTYTAEAERDGRSYHGCGQ
ncbi:MAG TPA: hypothetical protein PKC76_09625 [Saprospiraceae bacterium]|nr:hypothetical protein [Saprospiraceae bacterium]HMP24380.1 hypothetical protein [Saprospiraceae bacterium]